jgi:hypothetical protein
VRVIPEDVGYGLKLGRLAVRPRPVTDPEYLRDLAGKGQSEGALLVIYESRVSAGNLLLELQPIWTSGIGFIVNVRAFGDEVFTPTLAELASPEVNNAVQDPDKERVSVKEPIIKDGSLIILSKSFHITQALPSL